MIMRFLALTLMTSTFSTAAQSNCRGCCSGHGGVICSANLQTTCKDGAPISPACKTKGCTVCKDEVTSKTQALIRQATPHSKKDLPLPPLKKVIGIKLLSFSQAKVLMEKKIYFDHLETFYCRAPFIGRSITPSKKYTPMKDNKRSRRLEWEHVVPAHAFGQSFKEWREGSPDCVSKGKHFSGRNCATKTNMEFRAMEANMYNLVPAIGEINGLRSNYSFAELKGKKGQFGHCQVLIEDRKIDPPDDRRGDIARIYFYMDGAYPGRGIVSKKNRPMFDAWNKLDPVDPWECERYRRIKFVYGQENSFMGSLCSDPPTPPKGHQAPVLKGL